MSDVVVIHDIGDAAAGEPWRALGVHAPDLPGHGSAPAPRNGSYDASVAILTARDAIRDGALERPVCVGVGDNAYAAVVLAIAGEVGALVLVDGLDAEWEAPAATIERFYARLRAIADDAAAVGPPPAAGLDPRAAHRYDLASTPAFAQRLWGAVEVPVLLVETPSSPTPPVERAQRASWFTGPTTVRDIASTSPRAVLDALAAWQHA